VTVGDVLTVAATAAVMYSAFIITLPQKCGRRVRRGTYGGNCQCSKSSEAAAAAALLLMLITNG